VYYTTRGNYVLNESLRLLSMNSLTFNINHYEYITQEMNDVARVKHREREKRMEQKLQMQAEIEIFCTLKSIRLQVKLDVMICMRMNL